MKKMIVPVASALALLSTAAAAEPAVRARMPQGPGGLVTNADYPMEAIRNNEQGVVGFRLDIGSDGMPTGCTVTSSSGSAILDSATCRLMMHRARFEPARDSKGRPTTDSYQSRFRWVIPNDPPGRANALTALWAGCVMGEAAKLVPGDLGADEIVKRSFPPCASLEALLSREVKQPMPIEGPRKAMVQRIEQGVEELRKILNATPAAAAAKDPS